MLTYIRTYINHYSLNLCILLYLLSLSLSRSSLSSQVRNELSLFLNARAKVLLPGATGADISHMKRAMLRLVQVLPPPDKKTTLLEKLHSMK